MMHVNDMTMHYDANHMTSIYNRSSHDEMIVYSLMHMTNFTSIKRKVEKCLTTSCPGYASLQKQRPSPMV